MYQELARFLGHITRQTSLWKDGELWTAVIGGIVCGLWFYFEPSLISRVRQNFGQLLSAAQIAFGFILAVLALYIQAIAAWSDEPEVRRVARKIIDWHVWTILCFLILIGYLGVLWMFGPLLKTR